MAGAPPWSSLTGTAGLMCFAMMVFIELRVPEPMLDLRIFKDRMFRNSTGAFFMATAGLMGVLFLLPLYLQELRGFSALQSGLTTFPQALAMGVCLQFTSRLYPSVGPRRMLIFGLAVTTVSSACFLFVGLDTSIWTLRGIMLVRGFGMSFAVVSAQTATFATITPPQMGRASSLFSTNRQVAAAVGVAILGSVLANQIIAQVGNLTGEAARQATLSAFHDAFLVATVLGVLSVAFAFLVHDEDAAATMHRSVPAQGQTAQVIVPEAAGGS